MNKIFIMFTLLVITFSNHAYSKIHQFQTSVEKECSSSTINELLLKKSLIELINGGGCESKFTSIVIKNCEQMDCQRLQAIYKNVQQAKRGNE